MSRVPGHRTSSCSIFLFLSLLLHFNFNLHVVSGTFVAGSEEATQRTLRATLLGDVVAEELPGVGRVSASSDSATFLVVADRLDREEGRGRRLGAQGRVYAEWTSGRCTDVGAGWENVKTAEACGEGASAVGWSDVRAGTVSKKRPRGCYLDNNEYSLNFNTYISSTDTCSANFRCVCSVLCQPGTYQDQTGKRSCTGQFAPNLNTKKGTRKLHVFYMCLTYLYMSFTLVASGFDFKGSRAPTSQRRRLPAC
mgnify:CR=1 FL=1